MGLSASQGRMLSLTSRLSDLEFRAQAIQNQKIRLADQSEAVSKNYLDALNAKKLTAYNPETHTQMDASLQSLYTLNGVESNGKKRVIVDASGKTVVPASYLNEAKNGLAEGKNINAIYYTTEEKTEKNDKGDDVKTTVQIPHSYADQGYVACPAGKESDTEYLYQQLAAGNWFIKEYDEAGGPNHKGGWEEISYSSGDAQLMVMNDDFELAKAEADYEAAMDKIQQKDKRFDLELQTIDTEHSAIQTEMDSVNKVMDKNIDRTFKIFG